MLRIRPGFYSKSDAEFIENYEFLCNSGLQTVIDYTNWHSIRHEWVECFKGANFTLGEKMNNRLECIDSKIKTKYC